MGRQTGQIRGRPEEGGCQGAAFGAGQLGEGLTGPQADAKKWLIRPNHDTDDLIGAVPFMLQQAVKIGGEGRRQAGEDALLHLFTLPKGDKGREIGRENGQSPLGSRGP